MAIFTYNMCIKNHNTFVNSQFSITINYCFELNNNFCLFIFLSFDGGNEEWISTISQAFEGFSDFKKIDGGQETDLK